MTDLQETIPPIPLAPSPPSWGGGNRHAGWGKGLLSPYIIQVQASAGSGKTHALAWHYLGLLLSPAGESQQRGDQGQETGNRESRSLEVQTSRPPEVNEILAITFTNKAAKEMRQRILDTLKRMALDTLLPEDKIQLQSLWKGLSLPSAHSFFPRRAQDLLNHLLTHYHHFRVQTSDSFLTHLAQASSVELAIPFYFEIDLNIEQGLAYALDRVLEGVTPSTREDSVTRFFLRLLDHLLMVEKRVRWGVASQVLEWALTLRSYQNRHTLQQPYDIQDWEEQKKRLRTLLDQVLHVMNREGMTLKGNVTPLSVYREGGKEIWECVSLKKDDVSAVFKAHRCHSRGGGNPGSLKKDDVSTVFKGMVQKDFPALWGSLRQAAQHLTEIQGVVRALPDVSLMTVLEGSLQGWQGREHRVFLDDLRRQLRQVLESDVDVPSIYLRLGTVLSYFLVDEFQDTSAAEWQAIHPLVEESLSQGGGLFYVGDGKQAIYGFKGGDVRLFDQVVSLYPSVAADHVQRECLQKNYRSGRALVQWVGEVFSEANLRRMLSPLSVSSSFGERLYAHFASARQEPAVDAEGYVRIEHLPEEPQNAERVQEAILSRLERLLKDDVGARFEWSDVAVLARSNAEVTALTEELSSRGIPVVSSRSMQVTSSFCVTELLSFLHFLDSPLDNLSFSSFIGGHIFQRASGFESSRWFGLLEPLPQKPPVHYLLFRETFPEFWREWLEDFFQQVGYLPPYDLVQTILRRYRLVEYFPDQAAFLYGFLEFLSDSEKKGENHLKKILQTMEDLQEQPGSDRLNVPSPRVSGGVQVMTIHKAKGLDFPVVIYPFAYLSTEFKGWCVEERGQGAGDGPGVEESAVGRRQSESREARESRSRGEVWESRSPEVGEAGSRAVEKGQDTLTLYALTSAMASFSPKLWGIYQRSWERHLWEALNVLYVALTRAKQELYVFCPHYAGASSHGKTPLVFPEPWERGCKTPRRLTTNFQTSPRLLDCRRPTADGQWLTPGLLDSPPSRRPTADFSTSRLPDSPSTSGLPWSKGLKQEHRILTLLTQPERLQKQKRGTEFHQQLARGAVPEFFYTAYPELFPRPSPTPGLPGLQGGETLSRQCHSRGGGNPSSSVFSTSGLLDFSPSRLLSSPLVLVEQEIITESGEALRVDRLVIYPDKIYVIDFKTGRPERKEDEEQVQCYGRLLRRIFPDRSVIGYLLYINPDQPADSLLQAVSLL